MPEYDDLCASAVLDANGNRVGGVCQVYLDDATGEATFVTARTGLFGNKEVCVPLADARLGDGLIQVPYPAEAIKTAPQSPGRRFTPEQEAEVYRHYGLPYVNSESMADPGAAEAIPARTATPRSAETTALPSATVGEPSPAAIQQPPTRPQS